MCSHPLADLPIAQQVFYPSVPGLTLLSHIPPNRDHLVFLVFTLMNTFLHKLAEKPAEVRACINPHEYSLNFALFLNGFLAHTKYRML